MKTLFTILASILFSTSGKSQSSISFPETVTYINNILKSNRKDRWCVYKMDADKYGNVKFYCTMGQYWFNINDALDVNNNNFKFPRYYEVKFSLGNEGVMSYNEQNSFWPGPYGGAEFINLANQDKSRLDKAFKYLKILTKDPFTQ